MKRKHIPALLLALSMLTACGAESQTIPSAASVLPSEPSVQEEAALPELPASEEETAEPVLAAPENAPLVSTGYPAVTGSEEYFTSRELDPNYDTAETITLSDGASTSSSDAAEVDGDTITITAEGVYEVSGTLSDGMVIVDVPDTDKVQLVLQNVTIHSETSAAIYVRQADKVFLTLAENSENSLSSGQSYEAIDDSSIDAAVFSKDDLALNGIGNLTVSAPAGHGIVSKDDLVIAGGSYTISALDHGLSANDSICIADGTFVIDTGKDGIHAENADDPQEGLVYAENGTFALTTAGDGISASGSIILQNGSFDLTTGGGTGAALQYDENGDPISCKGLKSGSDITVNRGSFSMNCADDALHGTSSVLISDGSFTITTSDDGIHADTSTEIQGGDITISQCYEGIEGTNILISGGTIRITAQDDGINAAGGTDGSGWGGMFDTAPADGTSESTSPTLEITGGTIVVDAEGDSLDANGSLYVSGGDITIYGTVRQGNGILDYDREGTISGGTLAATGISGMSPNFSTASTQGSLMVSTGAQEAGTEYTITDAQGNVLFSGTAAKSFDLLLFSCPQLTVGETYTVTAGSFTTEVEMTTLIVGGESSMGGKGGRSF